MPKKQTHPAMVKAFDSPLSRKVGEGEEIKRFGLDSLACESRPERRGPVRYKVPAPNKTQVTIAASQKTLYASTARLPWPPPKQGALIQVAESSLAVYCILFGYSEWHLANPRPWLYFRPMRCLRGRTTAEACGGMEKLTLFRGLNGDARRKAGKIFALLAASVCELAAKENGNA